MMGKMSSPIYAKLPDADDSRSSNASERLGGYRQNQMYPHISPDHIPRSHEQQPYLVLDQGRRYNLPAGSGGSGGVNRGGAGGSGMDRITPDRMSNGEVSRHFPSGKMFSPPTQHLLRRLDGSPVDNKYTGMLDIQIIQILYSTRLYWYRVP